MINLDGYNKITIFTHDDMRYFVYSKADDNNLHFFILKEGILERVDENINEFLNKLYFDKNKVVYSKSDIINKILTLALTFQISISSFSPSLLNNEKKLSLTKKSYSIDYYIKDNIPQSFFESLKYTLADVDGIDDLDPEAGDIDGIDYSVDILIDEITEICNAGSISKFYELIELFVSRHNLNDSEDADLIFQISDPSFFMDVAKELCIINSYSISIKEFSTWVNEKYQQYLSFLIQKDELKDLRFNDRLKTLYKDNTALIELIKNYPEEYFDYFDSLTSFDDNLENFFIRINDILSKEEKLQFIIDSQNLSDISDFILKNIDSTLQYCFLYKVNLSQKNYIDKEELVKFIVDSNKRFDKNNISLYIKKYNLENYSEAIYNNPLWFLRIIDGVEKNINLLPEVKREFLTKIDYMNDYKYIDDIDVWINNIPYLSYEYRHDIDGAAGTFKSQNISIYGSLPLITIDINAKGVRNHEAFHFIGATEEAKTYVTNIYYDSVSNRFYREYDENRSYISLHGAFFEEGFTELVSNEYQNSIPDTYYLSHSLVKALAYIFGEDICVEMYHSKDGIIPLLNKLLDIGYSHTEIETILTRFEFQFTAFETVGHNDINSSTTTYLIVEDLLNMYDKIYNSDYKSDFGFLIVLNNLIQKIDFEEIKNNYQNLELPDKFEEIESFFEWFKNIYFSELQIDGYELNYIHMNNYKYINSKDNNPEINVVLYYINVDDPKDVIILGHKFIVATNSLDSPNSSNRKLA